MYLKINATNWESFKSNINLTEDIINSSEIDDAVESTTTVIILAAEKSTPPRSLKIRKILKPWWNLECHKAQKLQKKQWNKFRHHPTTENLIAFKQSRSAARRIRRQSQRNSWQQYVSTITYNTPSKIVWEKIKKYLALEPTVEFPYSKSTTTLFPTLKTSSMQ